MQTMSPVPALFEDEEMAFCRARLPTKICWRTGQQPWRMPGWLEASEATVKRAERIRSCGRWAEPIATRSQA